MQLWRAAVDEEAKAQWSVSRLCDIAGLAELRQHRRVGEQALAQTLTVDFWLQSVLAQVGEIKARQTSHWCAVSLVIRPAEVEFDRIVIRILAVETYFEIGVGKFCGHRSLSPCFTNGPLSYLMRYAFLRFTYWHFDCSPGE